jgi:D-glycero-D-manno-heptose 1,7-bisphosphate phosphatase
VHDDLMSFAETLIQAERRRVAEQRGQALTPDTQAGDLN